MTKKLKQDQAADPEMVQVLMLDLNDPKWASYSGTMQAATGKTVSLVLRPGVHSLPIAKAEQLCRSFPFLFTMDPETDPDSSESSNAAAPDTSTASSDPETDQAPSESEV